MLLTFLSCFAMALVAMVCDARLAMAAELRLDTPQSQYAPNTDIPVSLMLDAQGATVNAVEAALQVTGALVVDIRDGNSAISLWPLRPKADGNQRVPFAGVFPGGHQGDGLMILTLILRASEEGEVVVRVEDPRVLRHDGRGTEAPVSSMPLAIRVTGSAPVLLPQAIASDREPPDAFMPMVVHEALIANGAYALLFLAQDKGSGIHHYEVFETPREITRETDVRWLRAESPHMLQDQTMKSFIYVKAIDRVGNERIVRMEPTWKRRWYEEQAMQDFLVWGVGFIFILGYIMYQYPWSKREKPFYLQG